MRQECNHTLKLTRYLPSFASFLHSAALPLVDLSLYTSFQNYYHATGPAWTKLLPFPLNYTIPPRRRAAARKRTAHLGLSSLDVDTVHDSPLETPSQRFEAEKKTAGLGVDAGPQPITTTQSPGMLPFSSARRKTILDKTQHSSLFRLSSLLSNLCDPLNDLLGDKLYLQKASSPTSLDCLALGYLSQIVYPRLPMSVLSEKINSRYPSLVTYVRRLHASLLDGRHEPSVVLSLAEFDSDDKLLIQARKERGLVLPWTPQVKPSLAVALLNGSREVFSSLPGVSRAYSEPTITTKESTTTLMAPYNPAIAVGTTLFGAVVATLHYFMTVQRTDNLTFVNPNRARQRGFGDLGAVLGFSNI